METIRLLIWYIYTCHRSMSVGADMVVNIFCWIKMIGMKSTHFHFSNWPMALGDFDIEIEKIIANVGGFE